MEEGSFSLSTALSPGGTTQSTLSICSTTLNRTALTAALHCTALYCTPPRCDVEQPYSLACCGHTYCHTCLEAMLSSATRSNAFPVRCCAPGCTHPVSLADVASLLPAQQLSDAYKAAFRAFVEVNHDGWGNCLTADCPQVGLWVTSG